MFSTQDNFHVAVIMDGNGRWAQSHGMDRLRGHIQGIKTLRRVIECSLDLKVKYLTVFAFSTENWKRSEYEVQGLMTLFRRAIESELKNKAARLDEDGICVRFIGRPDELDEKLLSMMAWLEKRTAQNSRFYLTVAVNYGGRDEIVRAVQNLAKQVISGVITIDDITENTFAAALDTVGLPDPDLILRTSGEYRTSNFLPWQSIYSEYVFEKTAWPDFNRELFIKIIGSFTNRSRRFGGVKIQ